MKYCTNCGTQNDANTNFCSNCGQNMNPTNISTDQTGFNGKQKNGKAIASMVLGIVAVIWAFIELFSLGDIENALVEAIAESSSDNVFAGKIGFFIGYNLLSLPCGIIGLILGLLSKKNGKSIAGIITSLVALAIAVISLVVILGVEI